jgi:hypothetical protein
MGYHDGTILLMGCMCMAATVLGASQSVSAASVSLLSNGMQVLVQEDERFPLVSLRLYVHAGSAYEDPSQAGISHLLEHMVFKGTAKRAPGEVAGDIERAGGYLNASTGFDQTVYKIDLPAEHWALGLDVLQDMIFGATIDLGELESEKQVVFSEIERSEDSPQRKLFNSLQSRSGPGHPMPMAHPRIQGDPGRDHPEDIKRYIARKYQPQKMVLVVCGNISKHEVLPEVERLFGKLTNSGERLPLQPPAVAPAGRDMKPRSRSCRTMEKGLSERGLPHSRVPHRRRHGPRGPGHLLGRRPVLAPLPHLQVRAPAGGRDLGFAGHARARGHVHDPGAARPGQGRAVLGAAHSKSCPRSWQRTASPPGSTSAPGSTSKTRCSRPRRPWAGWPRSSASSSSFWAA